MIFRTHILERFFGQPPVVRRDPRAAREELRAAQAAEDTRRALSLCDELCRLEPTEPRWPQRRGDILRASGRPVEAARAYVLAAKLFEARGLDRCGVVLLGVARELDAGAAPRPSLHPMLLDEGAEALGG